MLSVEPKPTKEDSPMKRRAIIAFLVVSRSAGAFFSVLCLGFLVPV